MPKKTATGGKAATNKPVSPPAAEPEIAADPSVAVVMAEHVPATSEREVEVVSTVEASEPESGSAGVEDASKTPKETDSSDDVSEGKPGPESVEPESTTKGEAATGIVAETSEPVEDIAILHRRRALWRAAQAQLAEAETRSVQPTSKPKSDETESKGPAVTKNVAEASESSDDLAELLRRRALWRAAQAERAEAEARSVEPTGKPKSDETASKPKSDETGSKAPAVTKNVAEASESREELAELFQRRAASRRAAAARRSELETNPVQPRSKPEAETKVVADPSMRRAEEVERAVPKNIVGAVEAPRSSDATDDPKPITFPATTGQIDHVLKTLADMEARLKTVENENEALTSYNTRLNTRLAAVEISLEEQQNNYKVLEWKYSTMQSLVHECVPAIMDSLNDIASELHDVGANIHGELESLSAEYDEMKDFTRGTLMNSLQKYEGNVDSLKQDVGFLMNEMISFGPVFQTLTSSGHMTLASTLLEEVKTFVRRFVRNDKDHALLFRQFCGRIEFPFPVFREEAKIAVREHAGAPDTCAFSTDTLIDADDGDDADGGEDPEVVTVVKEFAGTSMDPKNPETVHDFLMHFAPRFLAHEGVFPCCELVVDQLSGRKGGTC
jgi:hypothetical protein